MTAIDHVSALRRAVLANGYQPVAVKSGDKAPAGMAWQMKRGLPLTTEAALNTGILCEGLCPADIDVDDADAVEAIVKVFDEVAGHTPLVRGRPNSPRRLLLYRAPDGTKPRKRIINLAPLGKIELLGLGQQFVAYGMHPSGVEFEWPEAGPDVVSRAEVPILSGEQEAEIERRLRSIFDQVAVTPEVAPAPMAAQQSWTTPARPSMPAAAAGGSPSDFFDRVKRAAMARLDAWVPALFPGAKHQPGTGAYRITSRQLGRDLEEDLSIAPNGIVDFGVADMGDPNEGKRTAIDLVMEHGGAPDARAACQWLCDRLGLDFDDLWQETHPEPAADQVVDAAIKPFIDGLSAKPDPSPSSQADPVDLWGKFHPPALPAGLLPPVIETFARVQSELMGVDPGGLAAAALAVCAAAIPDSIKLQVKQHDESWTESARLWVALIGDPSTRKTPMISQAVRPLTRIDAALYRNYAQAMAEFEALPKEDQKVATRPRQTRLRIEDTTIEAAQEVLKDSPEGVLCIQDELSGWFGAMDKYSGNRGSAKDRGFWLQSFNGGQYALNRIARGAGFIENLSVSMLGGIQPDPLRRIAGDSVDDGLLQRLFPIVLRPATLGQDKPTPDVVGRYGALVEALHSLTPPVFGGGNVGRLLPTVMRFDAGAHEVRRALERRHLELMGAECFNKKLAAHVGKYDGLFARLCIIWHCVEHAEAGAPPSIISVDIAQRVATFLHRFLLRHSIAFYAGIMGLSDDHDRITAVAGYILAHKLEVVTNRDVQRGDRTMRGIERHDIQRILEQLDALGWLTQVAGKRPTDPPHWKVNPAVHRLFTERAAAESARRRDAHEMIARVASDAP